MKNLKFLLFATCLSFMFSCANDAEDVFIAQPEVETNVATRTEINPCNLGDYLRIFDYYLNLENQGANATIRIEETLEVLPDYVDANNGPAGVDCNDTTVAENALGMFYCEFIGAATAYIEGTGSLEDLTNAFCEYVDALNTVEIAPGLGTAADNYQIGCGKYNDRILNQTFLSCQ